MKSRDELRQLTTQVMYRLDLFLAEMTNNDWKVSRISKDVLGNSRLLEAVHYSRVEFIAYWKIVLLDKFLTEKGF
jgi:hypothetical protein